MSFRSKGTVDPTVIVSLSPDRSGNYVCDAAVEAHNVTIQRAIDYLNTIGGGHLHIKEGAYVFATRVNVPYSDIMISGDGKETVITHLGALNTFSFSHTSEISNIDVRDIKFVGEPTDNENEILVFNYVSGFTVENCLFQDSGDEAIQIAMGDGVCRNGIIRGNHFIDCTSADVNAGAISLQCGHMIVDGNIIEGGTGFGIILEAIVGTELIERVSIVNNIIKTPGLVGILLNANDYDIENCIVDNNEIYDATLGGIMDALAGTNTVSYVIISNNIIEGGGTDAAARGAISFSRNTPENNIICDNIIRTWDVANGNKHGIMTAGDGTEFIITGNQIDGVGDCGIFVASSNTIVTGNTIEHAGQAGAGTRSGIQINANDVLCLGNFIEDSLSGIRVTGGSNNIVKDNKFTNIAVFIFTDAGTNTAVHEVPVSVPNPDANVGDHPALLLPDAIDTTFRFQLPIPLEFQQLVTAQVIVAQIVTAAGPPDMQWSTTTDWGKLCAAENYNAGSDAETDQTTAVAQNNLVCIDVSASLTGIAAGDLVGFTFIRRASQAGDTIDAAAYFLGFRLRYV